MGTGSGSQTQQQSGFFNSGSNYWSGGSTPGYFQYEGPEWEARLRQGGTPGWQPAPFDPTNQPVLVGPDPSIPNGGVFPNQSGGFPAQNPMTPWTPNQGDVFYGGQWVPQDQVPEGVNFHSPSQGPLPGQMYAGGWKYPGQVTAQDKVPPPGNVSGWLSHTAPQGLPGQIFNPLVGGWVWPMGEGGTPGQAPAGTYPQKVSADMAFNLGWGAPFGDPNDQGALVDWSNATPRGGWAQQYGTPNAPEAAPGFSSIPTHAPPGYLGGGRYAFGPRSGDPNQPNGPGTYGSLPLTVSAKGLMDSNPYKSMPGNVYGAEYVSKSPTTYDFTQDVYTDPYAQFKVEAAHRRAARTGVPVTGDPGQKALSTLAWLAQANANNPTPVPKPDLKPLAGQYDQAALEAYKAQMGGSYYGGIVPKESYGSEKMNPWAVLQNLGINNPMGFDPNSYWATGRAPNITPFQRYG